MQPIARRYMSTAACVSAACAIIAALVVRRSSLHNYLFLPVLALLLELMARLYDARILRAVRAPAGGSQPQRARDGDGGGVFTWQQLAQHNHELSAWIAIHGRVYDVTQFVQRHPGGSELLLLAVGRDATDLFESYHPFTDAPNKLLHKMHIGSLGTYEHPVYKPDSGFYRDACAAVKAYFERSGLDSKEPRTAFVRMAPVYALFAGAFYGAFVAREVALPMRALLAVLMGCAQGMPLTGWMHDASHSALGGSERWWWSIGRLALDYVSGSSMLSWRNQHVIGHHVYTNVFGADPDLPVSLSADARRLVRQQRWARVYRWQHLYLPPLYGLLAIKSRVQDLSEVFSRLSNGPVRVNPIAVQDYLRLLSSKSVWAFYRFVLPLCVARALPAAQFAALLLLAELSTGYWLAFNFQVSHVSSEAQFLFSDVSKRAHAKCPALFDDEWAHSQLRTTVDYAHGSAAAAYLSGALNYQTVHHLFPTVSQYHYAAITPIVMRVAAKHGLRFNVLRGFPDALRAHVQHLRRMGHAGQPAPLKLD
eukprot:TRINITY_DN147_c0_g2_i2.p1 TRINITY_DN147_c0_g2~~TRINITY_DN147_c0_g2_i2.p1  ORF type:complete len:536 (-),score=131.31 TRINITY_DN147_c0_g2_i2:442-2049(-)